MPARTSVSMEDLPGALFARTERTFPCERDPKTASRPGRGHDRIAPRACQATPPEWRQSSKSVTRRARQSRCARAVIAAHAPSSLRTRPHRRGRIGTRRRMMEAEDRGHRTEEQTRKSFLSAISRRSSLIHREMAPTDSLLTLLLRGASPLCIAPFRRMVNAA